MQENSVYWQLRSLKENMAYWVMFMAVQNGWLKSNHIDAPVYFGLRMAKITQTRSEQEIKILLVDDQPNVRQGLRMRLALEPDLVVIGEAGDGVTALELARKLHPNVVVMDVEMPTMDGITATRKLRELYPEIAVVMLSMYGDASTTDRAQAAGAAALVEKSQGEQELLAAIRRAAIH